MNWNKVIKQNIELKYFNKTNRNYIDIVSFKIKRDCIKKDSTTEVNLDKKNLKTRIFRIYKNITILIFTRGICDIHV